MRKQKQVTVNGEQYLITQFGAIQGLKLGKDVAKVILPVISKMQGSGEEVSIASVMEVIADNLDDISENTVVELTSGITKGGTGINFDNEFAGKYRALFEILWEVVELNYSDLFFGEPVEEESK